jgi:phosphoserine phosphatase RsbU/P
VEKMINDPNRSPVDRFALLYNLSQTLNSSLDLNEVLNRVMDEVIAATHAERGFVMLREDASAGEVKLTFKAARGMDQNTIEDPEFQISKSIVERTARTGESLLTSDAQADSRFNLRQSIMVLGLRSILCTPLKVKDKVIGVIYVDNRLQAGIFTKEDLELLNAIASTAAIAIENARLYQVAVDKGRMERELQMARKVQGSLLPESIPQAPGWEFAALWKPAREVGGDYFDFIPTKDRQNFIIADVTDKGMPAALFMAFTRTAVRASLRQSSSPSESLRLANHLICADSNDALFVSLFLGSLNPETGELTYANAGHHPPFHYSREKNVLLPLKSTGMQLGMDPYSSYKQHTILLQPGDFVFLYTDGVTDAANGTGLDFGIEGIQQNLLSSTNEPADGIVHSIDQAIENFAGELGQFDDVTILVAKRVEKC